MKISLVIPAYNEESRICETLSDYYEYFKKNYDDLEIIVVCDGCTDGTPNIIKKYSMADKRIKNVILEKKCGKGNAIITGFKKSDGDIIGFTDADESVSPEDFSRLIETTNEYDCVIASRWLRESVVLKKQSTITRIFSRIFNVIVNLMFDLKTKDTQCGAKVFKKDAIERILPLIKSRGYETDVELLWRIKKLGYKIKELPITWTHKGMGKFKLIESPKMLFSLLKIRLNIG